VGTVNPKQCPAETVERMLVSKFPSPHIILMSDNMIHVTKKIPIVSWQYSGYSCCSLRACSQVVWAEKDI